MNGIINVYKDEYEKLMAAYRTLFYYANPTIVCPKCGEYYMLKGYVCFGCRYDGSKLEE